MKASHIDFVHDKRHMDVGGGGWGGLAPVMLLGEKSCKNFDSLMKIFNILKSSMQNQAFS